jgi:hypothetical protein
VSCGRYSALIGPSSKGWGWGWGSISNRRNIFFHPDTTKIEANQPSNIREILDDISGLVDEDSPHQVAGLRKIFIKSSNDFANQLLRTLSQGHTQHEKSW